MAEVFLCATGQLTAQSRRELRKAGVVVVEVDNPAQCQFIRATQSVPADDMLWAALDALTTQGDHANRGTHQRERFTVSLFNLINAARSADGGQPA